MIDKNLLRLLGNNKKNFISVVLLMFLGVSANIGIIACICYAINIVNNCSNNFEVAKQGLINPLVTLILLLGIRYVLFRLIYEFKDMFKRQIRTDIKDMLFEKRLESNENLDVINDIYLDKIDLLEAYYTDYLSQLFFAILVPIVLFIGIATVNWKIALTYFIFAFAIIVLYILFSKKYTNNKLFNLLYFSLAFLGIAIGIIISINCLRYGELNTYKTSRISYGLFLIMVSVEFYLPILRVINMDNLALAGIDTGYKVIDILESNPQKEEIVNE